jgi:hypothetical protein
VEHYIQTTLESYIFFLTSITPMMIFHRHPSHERDLVNPLIRRLGLGYLTLSINITLITFLIHLSNGTYRLLGGLATMQRADLNRNPSFQP